MNILRMIVCVSWILFLCTSAVFAQSTSLAEVTATDEQESSGFDDVKLIQAASIPTAPSLFVGVTPCRVVDTRGNGFGGQYGPPILTDGVPRDIVFIGRCGIPANAQAVSTNITAILPSNMGNLRVFPKGGVVPQVSTVNFREGQNTSNAAIVPLGDDGAMTVFSSFANTDLVIDVNGYFVAPPAAQKICTIFSHSGDWRETVPVPSSWTAAQCNAYRTQTVPGGFTEYQLGCVFETGISLGAMNGGIPSPNCGW
jgi:hypothetical protein